MPLKRITVDRLKEQIDEVLKQAQTDSIEIIQDEKPLVVIAPYSKYRKLQRTSMMSHIKKVQEEAAKNGLTR